MQETAIQRFHLRVSDATKAAGYVKSAGKKDQKKPLQPLEIVFNASNMAKTKSTFVGISGLSPKAIEAIRARARDNNRSVSGELREIIEAELSSCDSSAHGAQTTGGN